jgi:hypothetical protein
LTHLYVKEHKCNQFGKFYQLPSTANLAQMAGVGIGADGELQQTKLFSDFTDDGLPIRHDELGTATMDISASSHR